MTKRHDSRPTTERLIRIGIVKDMTGLSRPMIYRLIQRGQFPRVIHPLGHCRVAAWLESEVQEWIADRIKAAKSTRQPPN